MVCESFVGTASDRRLVVGGDFNISLNLETPETTPFKNPMCSHGLYLTTWVPTRCLLSVWAQSPPMCTRKVM